MQKPLADLNEQNEQLFEKINNNLSSLKPQIKEFDDQITAADAEFIKAAGAKAKTILEQQRTS